jgi:cytochrome c-type biogenesis protein CcmH
LHVKVSLAPALKTKLAAGDTLFVYARAENGPPMPLAVARLDASKLPTTVTLTDAMSMMPTMKLSSVRRMFSLARESAIVDRLSPRPATWKEMPAWSRST